MKRIIEAMTGTMTRAMIEAVPEAMIEAFQGNPPARENLTAQANDSSELCRDFKSLAHSILEADSQRPAAWPAKMDETPVICRAS